MSKLCFPAFLPQPHTLFSLVSVHLAQGNVTGALAFFRHILTTALSSSSSFSSLAGCEQCRSSLPLLRCLQFYPFLYNLSQRQPCSRKRIKYTDSRDYLKQNGFFFWTLPLIMVHSKIVSGLLVQWHCESREWSCRSSCEAVVSCASGVTAPSSLFMSVGVKRKVLWSGEILLLNNLCCRK